MRAVWVVDDSPLDLERASRALGNGYRVTTFEDGAGALERLAGGGDPPTVLVVDWVLPQLSGLDICRFVRGEPRLRGVGILMLTARSGTDEVVEGLDAGANDFLTKPYADAELAARVASLVRSRALLERAEAAERALSAILARSPDALFGVDGEGTVVYANPAAGMMLGRDPDALVGQSLAGLLPFEEPERWLRQGATGGAPDLRLGDQRYAPSVEQGTGVGAEKIIALRNVTAQRRIDERRLDLYASAVHDLRTPLQAAMLRCELLADGTYGDMPAEALPELARLQDGFAEMLVMTNDFLDVARLDSGVGVGSRSPLSPAVLVREVAVDLDPLIEQHRLRFELRDESDGARVDGNRSRLKQVVLNLVSNAIKFTPAGGRVEARIFTVGDRVRVEIHDTGRGIDPDALPTLFERFSRSIDDSHEVMGTGLGLMIVKETVQAHGGEVGVDSARGVGSTFWFELDRVEAPPGPHV